MISEESAELTSTQARDVARALLELAGVGRRQGRAVSPPYPLWSANPVARTCLARDLVIDEVGYIPFESEAANLFFQLVSACYERASLIVTSNKPFGRWGEVFGDDVVAAMIDRLVHYAEVIALKGDSYQLKDRDLGRGSTSARKPPIKT